MAAGSLVVFDGRGAPPSTVFLSIAKSCPPNVERRRRGRRCRDCVIVAPLWPLHGADLGTLPRACDAAGACMAVPRLPWVAEALARGNTVRHPACAHWTGRDSCQWLREQRSAGKRITGVELAGEAIRLAGLPAARQPAIAVLGHEQTGIPAAALDLPDEAAEIPMTGRGASLNVAAAGSLVLYRLARFP